MTTYPGAIDEFRNTTNIPGVEYDADDTSTIFAEDTNAQSEAIVAIEETLGTNPQGSYPTVADRLAAGGGGGGAWETVFDEVIGSGVSEILIDSLDLVEDGIYEVYFSLACPDEITLVEFGGASAIFMGVQGFRVDSGSFTGQFSIPFLSHPSIGDGVGNLRLQASSNGSAFFDINYSVGNQRMYKLIGADSNYYSGGINLTYIKFKTQTGYYMTPGGRVTVMRKAA